ncbi:unnamed protein product [Ambrosiozyma monospora]|uniref:Unnamed protein product n=1 Tax=Ambrosiozyma monospora TaxID=43982 RepID=A0A9W6WD86_AMBMO|nr:unnamed protein product [Ambrosiozyma monospora]
MEVTEVGGQAVLGRQVRSTTPWPTERHGYDPTSIGCILDIALGLRQNSFRLSEYMEVTELGEEARIRDFKQLLSGEFGVKWA